MGPYELNDLLLLLGRSSIDDHSCSTVQSAVKLEENSLLRGKHPCKDSAIDEQFNFLMDISLGEGKDLLYFRLNVCDFIANFVEYDLIGLEVILV